MASTYLDRVDNKTLGQMLVEKGALSEAQVQEALDVARQSGQRLGEALVSLGYIGRDALSYAIAEQYGQRPMELHPSMVDQNLLAHFDPDLLRDHTMLPLIDLGGELVVVVGDPNNQVGLDALARQRPGLTITPQLGESGQIQRCLNAFFGKPDNVPAARSAACETSEPDVRDLWQLEPTAQPDTPDSPEVLPWLFALAAEHWGRDVLLRQMGESTEVLLSQNRLEHAGADRSAVAVLTPVARWEVALQSIRPTVLRGSTLVPFTDAQAFHGPVAVFGGEIYNFHIVAPAMPGSGFMRIRALRRSGGSGNVALPEDFHMPAGGAVAHIHTRSADETHALVNALVCGAKQQNQVILLSANSHEIPGDIAVYPVPFVDAASAAQAHAATLVIFDALPGPGVVDRLHQAVSPPPAIVVIHRLDKAASGSKLTSNEGNA